MKNDIHMLVTLDISQEARQQIRKVSDRIKLNVIPASEPDEISDERWAEAEILYTWEVLPHPEKTPNLQWVQLQSAGVDAVVDHPLVQNKEIITTTMSGVITGQIAEYVLMAMLAFGQKLFKLRRFQRERKWPEGEEKEKGLLPIELRHSTVGILGYGSIGRQVARLLQPFGARVLAAKRDVMHPEDTGYIQEGMGDPLGDFFHRLYPLEALHSLLGESDYVVLTLPLTDTTHHLMDGNAFSAMKESAYLINVGRGELIDQAALVHALDAGQIAGAALDVFEEEPLPKESPLWGMDNVILSPHVSGLSRHLNEDTLSLFIENLNRYIADLPLHNQIDPQQGY
jgi:phosphoglycerate dehydrogenase-like enzyme